MCPGGCVDILPGRKMDFFHPSAFYGDIPNVPINSQQNLLQHNTPQYSTNESLAEKRRKVTSRNHDYGTNGSAGTDYITTARAGTGCYSRGRKTRSSNGQSRYDSVDMDDGNDSGISHNNYYDMLNSAISDDDGGEEEEASRPVWDGLNKPVGEPADDDQNDGAGSEACSSGHASSFPSPMPSRSSDTQISSSNAWSLTKSSLMDHLIPRGYANTNCPLCYIIDIDQTDQRNRMGARKTHTQGKLTSIPGEKMSELIRLIYDTAQRSAPNIMYKQIEVKWNELRQLQIDYYTTQNLLDGSDENKWATYDILRPISREWIKVHFCYHVIDPSLDLPRLVRLARNGLEYYIGNSGEVNEYTGKYEANPNNLRAMQVYFGIYRSLSTMKPERMYGYKGQNAVNTIINNSAMMHQTNMFNFYSNTNTQAERGVSTTTSNMRQSAGR